MRKIKRIVIATQNDGKVNEIKQIFQGVKGVTVVSAKEAGVTEDVVEDGKTFAANALKKAVFVAKRTGQWAMADDSGICVDALGGEPGVHSARWAGEGAPGNRWVELLLSKLQGVPEEKRTAHFETMAVLINPQNEAFFFRGIVRGRILVEPRGQAHPRLPYDIVFVPDGETRTFSEMSDDEKNAISHRGRAFAQLKEFIQRMS